MNKPTLLILAAGMGSRYEGLKQITPIGPSGEMIIDYSIHDAVKAGFGKVVFVIRENISDAFKEKFHEKVSRKIDVEYVNQELDLFTEGFSISNREKPWGTGHAILVAENLINEPFAVINADDYYGTNSFETMAKFLSNPENSNDYSMLGFILKNTLSEHGHVSRGVCKADDNNYLVEVIERTKISKSDSRILFTDENGMKVSLQGGETVSMNFWGFQPDIFNHLKAMFDQVEQCSDFSQLAETFEQTLSRPTLKFLNNNHFLPCRQGQKAQPARRFQGDMKSAPMVRHHAAIIAHAQM